MFFILIIEFVDFHIGRPAQRDRYAAHCFLLKAVAKVNIISDDLDD